MDRPAQHSRHMHGPCALEAHDKQHNLSQVTLSLMERQLLFWFHHTL